LECLAKTSFETPLALAIAIPSESLRRSATSAIDIWLPESSRSTHRHLKLDTHAQCREIDLDLLA
jgi:hypothetical protein